MSVARPARRSLLSLARGQIGAAGAFLLRPIEVFRTYRLAYLRPDIIAGLTVAVVTLPQAMAYALIAELPPEIGLYAAIVGAIVGGLWGSSAQLQTGPTNTTSLLILSVLLTIASPGTPEYIVAASMMAFLVGLMRLTMGLARLGILVNFVSDSVIVGFTAGAGALILINQIRNLLRLSIPSLPGLWQTLPAIASHLIEAHWPSAAIGGGTIALILVLRRINGKLPASLMAMIIAAIAVAVFGLDARGARVVGELPRGLPPFSPPPVTDLDLIGRMITGSLAVAAIGLVEAMSIARTIAAHTGQRLDSNQEFVGQGLASLACSFLSGYTCSGSFTRSAVNYESGAKTALASVFGGAFVLIAMLALAPLAAYVPLAALAGVLILTAIRLVDHREMIRIWQSGHGDRMIMVVTLLATLALPLQYAVLSGILLSLVHYLVRTSTPRVRTVLPSSDFRHFGHQPDKPACPQIGIIEILGDLYFGAVNHIEAYILEHLAQRPDQRYLLLRMQAVDHCDISGIHALESIARAYREQGGDVYLVRVHDPVYARMEASGLLANLGADHLLDPRDAIGHLFYRVIDPAICIYECPVRVFQECQNLPKQRYPGPVHLDADLDLSRVPTIDARSLWDSLHVEPPPRVIDVREPSEFRRAHVPDAQSLPLPVLLNHLDQIPRDQPVVLVCRSGRRSMHAAAYLLEHDYENVRVLRGGMIAWENAHLLEAVDRFGGARHE